MNSTLQIGLFIVSLFTLFIVLKTVISNKMHIRYSMIWIIWGISIVFISIFPNIIYDITNIIGIEIPVNTVFLIMIFLLYCLTFYVYLKLSEHNEKIINLNYEIALLNKKLEDLQNKYER